MKDISQKLSSYGYEEPKLQKKDGKWNAILYPPYCYCNIMITPNCCHSVESNGASKFNDPTVYGFYKSEKLTVRSTGEIESSLRSTTAAHELFHGVANAHLTITGNVDNFLSPEYTWIHEGGAEGFALFWAKGIGLSPDEDNERIYDIPLFTGTLGAPQEVRYQTAYFWEFVAKKENNSYKFMKDILDQDWSQNIGTTLGGVYQVHEGLIKAGINKGLFQIYKDFAKENLNDKKYFSTEHTKKITKIDEEFTFETSALKPISTQAAKVVVFPKELNKEEYESKQLKITIELEDKSNRNIHLFIEGEEIANQFSKDITIDFRNRDSIIFKIRIANINKEPHNSSDAPKQKLKVKIESFECPMLPTGISKMVYESTDPKGNKSLRMIYDLNVERVNNETQKGAIALSVYSFQADRHFADSWFDFECTAEGVVLQGTEIGYIPGGMTDMSMIDMKVVSNNNTIPHKPEVGIDLRDAKVVVHAEANSTLAGIFGLEMTSVLNNRKVVSKESITVPAGTFECFRLEYDSNASLTFTGVAGFMNLFKRRIERASRAKNVIWISENKGWIKQEIKNNEGTSIFELVSLIRD